MHPLSGLTRQPLDGVTYQTGDDLEVTNLVAYAGTGNSVTVTNLSPVLYCFAVYSYTLVGSTPVYNLNAATGSLEALGLPQITADPVSKALYPGRTAQFRGAAQGTSPLRYQWQKGGVNLVDGGNVSGAQTPALAIAYVTAADAGSYTLTVTNDAGGVVSSPATLTLVPPSGSAYEAAVMSYGPLAYWRLNEANSAPTAFDYWGGLDGTCTIFASLGVAGPGPASGISLFESTNTAVAFDGGATSAPITTPPLNLNGNQVTMTCWVNPPLSPNSDRAGFFTCTGPNTAGAGFRYATGGVNLGCVWNNTAINSTLPIPANQWSFLAVAVSPTQVALYVGTPGSALQSQITTGTYAVQGFDGTGLIGSDRNVGGRYLVGVLDELAMFNFTMTPDQVAGLFAGVENKPPLAIARSGNNLLLSWPVQFTGFTLKSSPTLGPAAVWNTVPGTPVQANGMNTLAPLIGDGAFYRLVK
jgi:hypothetical protein